MFHTLYTFLSFYGHKGWLFGNALEFIFTCAVDLFWDILKALV
jgi:hypothetical protein